MIAVSLNVTDTGEREVRRQDEFVGLAKLRQRLDAVPFSAFLVCVGANRSRGLDE